MQSLDKKKQKEEPYGPNLPRVIVFWQDTYHTDPTIPYSEARGACSYEHATIGFLAKRGKYDTVLIGEMSSSYRNVRDTTAIPNRCINRIDRLKVEKTIYQT